MAEYDAAEALPMTPTENIACLSEFQFSNPVYDTSGDPDAKSSPDDPVYIYFADPPSSLRRKAPAHKVEFTTSRKCNAKRIAVLILLVVLLLGIAVALYFIVDFALNNKRIPTHEKYNSIRGSVRILNVTYSSQYAQPNTLAYQLLAKDITDEIHRLFVNSSMSSVYSSFRVVEFGEGSIIAYFEIRFLELYDSLYLETGSFEVIEEGIVTTARGDAFLGRYLVDSNSLQVTAIFKDPASDTSTTQEPSSVTPGSTSTTSSTTATTPTTTPTTTTTTIPTTTTTTTTMPSTVPPSVVMSTTGMVGIRTSPSSTPRVPQTTYIPPTFNATDHYVPTTRHTTSWTTTMPGIPSASSTHHHIPTTMHHIMTTTTAPTAPPPPTCERIWTGTCMNPDQVVYTQTIFPNQLGHGSQVEAAGLLSSISDVIQSGCYDYASGFLCSILLPKCDNNMMLPPCRSFCQDFFQSCGSRVPDTFGYSIHDCENLPQYDENNSGVCVMHPDKPMVLMRLARGAGIYEGRLEVYHDGAWGSVCEEGWDETDVYVVCQQLGYRDGGIARPGSYFGPGYGPVWLSNISCTGEEEHLAQCPHAPWGENNCTHEHDVGVMCFMEDAQSSVVARLSDSTDEGRGRLDLYYGERWGHVCTEGFGDADIRVVCAMMGFNGSGVLIENTFGGDLSYIWLQGVDCRGNETNIAFCDHRGWGQTNCGLDDLVAIQCDTGDIVGPEIRLVGGPDEMTGRVEVLHNSIWGTVCDDNLDQGTAQVVCQMLGYHGDASLLRPGIYGTGDGPIWLDEVNCQGHEASIFDCSSAPWGVHDCDHDEDMTVACSIAGTTATVFTTESPTVTTTTVMSTGPTMDTATTTMMPTGTTTAPVDRVRLANGVSSLEGTVELLYNGTWGTLCDDNFDDIDAEVICKTLGHSGVARRLIRFPVLSTGPVWIEDLNCTGVEDHVFQCNYSDWGDTNCDHYEDVYITCNAVDVPLRLAGGSQSWNGRLEIYHAGQWGTICDDWFDYYDAVVACRSLGYNDSVVPEVLGNQFSPGTGPIWLESLRCAGEEVHITDCRDDGWGQHNCDHGEDISMACRPQDYVPCEPIEFNLCADNLPYDGTGSPNLLGHVSQSEASNAFYTSDWHHIVGFCPGIMLQFACAMVFPECEDNELVKPCRSMCEEAHATCAPILEALGSYEWPPEFNCSALPEDIDTCFDMTDNVVTVTYPPEYAHCEPPLVPICDNGLAYNMTAMPNLLGQQAQSEAIESSFLWTNPISFDCHPLLRHFLCAVFTPECRADESSFLPLLPCQSVCLEVRLACEHYFFNDPWPAEFNCELFPSAASGSSCLLFKENDETTSTTTISSTTSLNNSSTRESSGVGIITETSLTSQSDTVSAALTPSTTTSNTTAPSVVSSTSDLPTESTSQAAATPSTSVSTGASTSTLGTGDVNQTGSAAAVRSTDSSLSTLPETTTTHRPMTPSVVPTQGTLPSYFTTIPASSTARQYSSTHNPFITYTPTSSSTAHQAVTTLTAVAQPTTRIHIVSAETTDGTPTTTTQRTYFTTVPYTPVVWVTPSTQNPALTRSTSPPSTLGATPSTTVVDGMMTATTTSATTASDVTASSPATPTPEPRCELIQMDACRGLESFYNYTLLPNAFQLSTQAETIAEASQYEALSNAPCSTYMRQFVCAVLFPKCDIAENPDTQIWVCRSVCEKVQSDCTFLLDTFGMPWPEFLDCSQFPSQQPCYDPALELT